MDQHIKLSQLITKQPTPFPTGRFSFPMGAVSLRPSNLSPPLEAKLAPRLRGFGYAVVEEQVAIVDLRTCKAELVFARSSE